MEKEFLQKLELSIIRLREEERLDIIRDFKEYFSNGRAEGKTDDEIIASLGPLEELSKELLSVYSEEEFITNVDMIPATETDFNRVDIKSNRANITIIPSSDEKPSIQIKDNDGKTNVVMEIENQTLKIRVVREENIKKFFFVIINVNLTLNVHVTILLPQKLYEELVVKNRSGKIEIQSLQAKKCFFKTDNGRIVMQDLLASSVKAETDNGRILLEKSNFTNVTATTDNGRIVVQDTKAEKFDLSTDNGRIELHNVTGEIWATTDNGRIEGYIPMVTKPLTWKTDNGSILLKTDQPLKDATLSAKTDLGLITVYGEKGKNFKFGNGTIPINFKTDMGRITVMTEDFEKVN